MVSTRRKSYQGEGGDSPPTPTTRRRSISLSTPSVDTVATPRRRRRTASPSLTSPAEGSPAPAPAPVRSRVHRKSLLARYRSDRDGAALSALPEAEAEEEQEAKKVEVVTETKPETEVGQEEEEVKKETVEAVIEEAVEADDAEVKENEADAEAAAPAEAAAEARQPTPAQKAKEAHRAAIVISRLPTTATEGGADEEMAEPDRARADAPPAQTGVDGGDVKMTDVSPANLVTPQTKQTHAAARSTALTDRKLADIQRILGSVPRRVGNLASAAADLPSQAPAQSRTPAPAEGLTLVKAVAVPRGTPKSGRFWKPVRTKCSSVMVRDRDSYEVRMQKRQQFKVMKSLENELKNERNRKKQELRKRREYNVKKTAENALKAEVYQVIKNPNKIKRMKKKQLRLLQTRDTTVIGKSVLEE